MNFKIISELFLEDGSKRVKILISGEELIFLGFILESLEGWCNYTTVKKNRPFLQLDIPPDFIGDVENLLGFLRKWQI
ncbi:MAG: hypothetical protein B6D62_04880 [Candidatus Cloacimonas sp. 4484_275]|nr:MAG: hypothetical protein B6D62_04880 [Candidatus Cloacimonas sp. 4484_275]